MFFMLEEDVELLVDGAVDMEAPLPSLQGVAFRHVPNYPGYAVASDGRVWKLTDESWWPIEPDLHSHLAMVWLDLGRGHCELTRVRDLVQQVFGGG